jgi:hypothetical protein
VIGYLFRGGLVALAAVVVTLLASAPAQAAPCTDPGPIATSITNDAAIEVHGLRRETAENCQAFLDASDAGLERLDLGWYGEWAIVGVLLGVMAGSMLNSAFRFWEGDDG